MAILVVGGSGYVGLHLLQSLLQNPQSQQLAYTYHIHSLEQLGTSVHGFQVDLATGQGFDAILPAIGIPSVVVNCAAISIPRTCELDPEKAMAINVPIALLEWILSFKCDNPPLLIHFSTDQVYEGIKQYYTEDDETKPVNVYGRSKLEAEKLIRAKWRNYAILRCSIIYGPQPFVPVAKTLPVQWMGKVLSEKKPVEFFHDEYRCPIFIYDVVNIVHLLIARAKAATDGGSLQVLLNAGGPDRLSRAEMAQQVAKVRGDDPSLVVPVSSKTVDRGVTSPADISMDVSKLRSSVPVGTNLTAFADGVRRTVRTG